MSLYIWKKAPCVCVELFLMWWNPQFYRYFTEDMTSVSSMRALALPFMSQLYSWTIADTTSSKQVLCEYRKKNPTPSLQASSRATSPKHIKAVCLSTPSFGLINTEIYDSIKCQNQRNKSEIAKRTSGIKANQPDSRSFLLQMCALCHRFSG